MVSKKKKVDKMKSMYEIVNDNVGEDENQIVTIAELKAIVLELAIENNFELVDSESWIKYINHGAKINDGYMFKSFKEDINEDILFALCTEILEVLEIKLFKVYDTHKIKINFTSVYPDSEVDNDQILYQMGYSNSVVSEFALYVENKHIANYGSILYGEQDVRVNYKDEDNAILVPINKGNEYRLHKEPTTLINAMKLQAKTDDEYLYYSNSCWLEGFIEDINNNDITKGNEILSAEVECVHGEIKENMKISNELLKEIIKAVK